MIPNVRSVVRRDGGKQRQVCLGQVLRVIKRVIVIAWIIPPFPQKKRPASAMICQTQGSREKGLVPNKQSASIDLVT